MSDQEQELKRLAGVLGGGWRIEQGVMPVIVLTLMEAQGLEARLALQDEPPTTCDECGSQRVDMAAAPVDGRDRPIFICKDCDNTWGDTAL